MASTIKYSSNWNNKLGCKVHTTFRMMNPNKFPVGSVHTEVLNGKPVNLVKVIQVIPKKLEQVTVLEAYADTGYNQHKFKKIVRTMYKHKIPNVDNVQFCFVVLEVMDSQYKLNMQ